MLSYRNHRTPRQATRDLSATAELVKPSSNCEHDSSFSACRSIHLYSCSSAQLSSVIHCSLYAW